jgi:16S rRNA pseudouridine516 synthase
MPAANSRLDRLLSKRLNIKRKSIKPLIAKGTVQVNDITVFDVQQPVNQFSKVVVDGQVIQNKQAHYIMLNKPKGLVSATSDTLHPTIMGLINAPFRDELRIVGRLDFNTTGLMLLTNDSDWASSLSHSDSNVIKRYLVTTEKPIDYLRYQTTFHQGIYFKPENITTLPATLTAISSHQAYLDISEGKYHQVKRMFGHFDNTVIALHRESIGAFTLCSSLAPGEYRHITPEQPSYFIRR